MSIFVMGQRWISDTELNQGIGTVTNVSNRGITLYFPATGETRTYSIANSPLTRICFNSGDTIESYEGWSATVISIEEIAGLYTYNIVKDNNEVTKLHETSLGNYLKLKSPQERLLTGNIGAFAAFPLRYQTFLHHKKLQQSKFRGLLGPKTGLLSHQLHIALQVADRYAPRIMLADEVGLGKTIEAGLIIHHQLVSGRASRVLIIIPDSLLHQWIVELLRKFNLAFKFFNEERCLSTEANNPFESEQLIICTESFFCNNEIHRTQIANAEFDLLVIDEAHHLIYEDQPNHYYQSVTEIIDNIPGLLLLTATPDHSGHKSHFERLKLIDKIRFYDFNNYLQEEQNYKSVAKIAQEICGSETISNKTINKLVDILSNKYEQEINKFNLSTIDNTEKEKIRVNLLQALIDRHGTGRILYRNTRESIGWLPKRKRQFYPQKLPELYKLALDKTKDLNQLLYPEVCYKKQIEQSLPDETIPWWQVDPRIIWLIDILKILIPQKVLIICANIETVIDIENALRVLSGIAACSFHENMSLINRDRSAAWFAEEGGSQVLICSEIGSEGRNFQFAHNLILFDLPQVPDLLEQRIGRLDRIGQQHNINIHIPYLQDTAQQTLFNWYDQGVNAFNSVATTSMMVYVKQQQQLKQLLVEDPAEIKDKLDVLIKNATKLAEKYSLQLKEGRDQLLELNSKGLKTDVNIANAIRDFENNSGLYDYAEELFNNLGVELEDYSKENFIVQIPGSVAHYFPSVTSSAINFSQNRNIALAREDIEFLSWEHPIINDGMEKIMSSEFGSTSVAILPNTKLPVGTVITEAIFLLEVIANKKLQLDRYLPPTPIRCLIDPNYKNLEKITFEALQKQLKSIDKRLARKLVKNSATKIVHMIKSAESFANEKAKKIISAAVDNFTDITSQSMLRLQALKQVNPNVRNEEIDFLQQKIISGKELITKARLRLDSIRLIITT